MPSIRLVPIHQELIAQGLLGYVDSVKADGNIQLWMTLTPGHYGWGDKVSKWFNDSLKQQCKIVNHPSGARKVWHSFRHAFISKAVSLGLALSYIQQIVGHEKSLMGETATYTHLSIVELSNAINKVQFKTH